MVISRAFLSGPWEHAELVDRARASLAGNRRWLGPLARRVLKAFPGTKPLPADRLADLLCRDTVFRRSIENSKIKIGLVTVPSLAPRMAPSSGPPAAWPVPEITTLDQASSFFEVSPPRLLWLADSQGRERAARHEPLRNYRYRTIAKAAGSPRLIESPKPMLKRIQRRLLDEILAKIPVHDAAHGFRSGRSVTSFVAGHVGRRVILKMDLRDFFPSITAARVVAIFMTAGYPEEVSRLLAGLCTNTVPIAVRRELEKAGSVRTPDEWHSRKRLEQPHLPQGAPTSPALANLAAHRLDVRLAGLARAAGACYTRYADDLLFSGDDEFARAAERFAVHVAAIALEEGFIVQHRKTRMMRQGVRQRAAGIVLNHHPNVSREDYDLLKATLHNCVRHGPDGQNRAGVQDFRAHLLGRIAHVASLNRPRGERLKRVFERIAW